MKAATVDLPRVQVLPLLVAGGVAAALFLHIFGYGEDKAALFAIGIAFGLALYHAAFGFSAAYRRLLVERDVSGVSAQLLMIGLAIVLFAPLLAGGSAFGQPLAGAVAPASISMALGAFAFGIGMQLAGGCASGTLYTAGGGSVRMLVVLVFFCLGGFWGSLDLHWWNELPGLGAVSLGDELGWPAAVTFQLAVLAAIYVFLRALGARHRYPLRGEGRSVASRLMRGPWPLMATAVVLAVLNVLTLVIAGHPWSITWAFALWPAKAAVALGWDPASSPFWSGAFQQAALARPIWADTVSVMNIGILLGAFAGAALAGRVSPTIRVPPLSVAAAIAGGLLMGYGARLAFGCNIGAFFSGVASTSLHGWLWIACAALGTVIGVRLRPRFGLAL